VKSRTYSSSSLGRSISSGIKLGGTKLVGLTLTGTFSGSGSGTRGGRAGKARKEERAEGREEREEGRGY
jgi:hypothetical protein